MPGIESFSVNSKDVESNMNKRHDDTSELLHGNKKHCRTCVDFKTWMKQTNKDAKTASARVSELCCTRIVVVIVSNLWWWYWQAYNIIIIITSSISITSSIIITSSISIKW